MLGLVAESFRELRTDGQKYDKYFPETLIGSDPIIGSGNTYTTMKLMKKIVYETLEDTAQIAKHPHLTGRNLEETSRKIWEWAYNNIQYKEDNPDAEELRRPARSWKDRITGIDCDCYSILISSILMNKGIKHSFRKTDYGNGWQHIYIVVHDKKANYVIDPVLDQFNAEKPYSKKFDKLMTDIKFLNGAKLNGPHGTTGHGASGLMAKSIRRHDALHSINKVAMAIFRTAFRVVLNNNWFGLRTKLANAYILWEAWSFSKNENGGIFGAYKQKYGREAALEQVRLWDDMIELWYKFGGSSISSKDPNTKLLASIASYANRIREKHFIAEEGLNLIMDGADAGKLIKWGDGWLLLGEAKRKYPDLMRTILAPSMTYLLEGKVALNNKHEATIAHTKALARKRILNNRPITRAAIQAYINNAKYNSKDGLLQLIDSGKPINVRLGSIYVEQNLIAKESQLAPNNFFNAKRNLGVEPVTTAATGATAGAIAAAAAPVVVAVVQAISKRSGVKLSKDDINKALKGDPKALEKIGKGIQNSGNNSGSNGQGSGPINPTNTGNAINNNPNGLPNPGFNEPKTSSFNKLLAGGLVTAGLAYLLMNKKPRQLNGADRTSSSGSSPTIKV